MTLTHQELKNKQRINRDKYHINAGLRIHRALSWLDRAEQCQDDEDGKFIFLWIAFNAAYANELDDSQRFTEKEVFRNFLDRLSEMDTDKAMDELIWSEFSTSIRLLLDNEFVFQGFWDYQNGKLSEEEWKYQFSGAKSKAHKALGGKDTGLVLSIIFNRLYTLRNQMIHGGATWNSQTNRSQIRDSVKFLEKLLPLIINIMMDNADQLWGVPCYPVIK